MLTLLMAIPTNTSSSPMGARAGKEGLAEPVELEAMEALERRVATA
jgi:hypothetical protein